MPPVSGFFMVVSHSCTEVPGNSQCSTCWPRLKKPPFYSVGVDCFGLLFVKTGCCQEKRWGILYKCMTTRCIHLDLLGSLDADAFLLYLRCFVPHWGKPLELLCDNDTNFTGWCQELKDAFETTATYQQEQLVQKICLQFHPPASPHSGGTWELEKTSVKTTLTLLIEVQGILNAKSLGRVSAGVADLDLLRSNMLLMGQWDSSLPQALYDSDDLLSKHCWRHRQVLPDNLWSSFV